MPVRHYALEYNVNNGPWLLGRADEAPGAGKQFAVPGLPVGTHAVKLRLVPLTGDPTPILSNEVIVQMGQPSLVEPMQVVAEAQVTVADLMVRRDSLIAAAGVVVSEADTAAMNDELLAAAGVTANVSDTRYTVENLVAAINADASAANVHQMVDQIIAAATAQATVADTQTGVIVDPVAVAATVTATVTDVRTMLEQVQAVVTAAATQADGAVRRDAASSAADVVAGLGSEVYTPGASAPTQPNISATGGDTTVTITLVSGGTGATSYELKWRLAVASGGDGTYSAYSVVTLPHAQTGLTNGNTYDFILKAVNALGSTESAEVSVVAGVPAAVTLAFESATITDSTGATWEKVTPSAVADGGVGVITSGVASVSGADGNCLSVKQSVYDDGNDFYAFDTFIRRTMNVGAGTLSLRVRRANSASAGWGYVKVGGTLYDLGFTTINTFVNKTLTIPAAQTNVVVEIGFTGGTAFLEGYIDSVSIPQ